LIDKAWSHVKTPDSSLGGKESANIVTNIMKDKNNFLMGLNKTEKKGRKKIMKNKTRKEIKFGKAKFIYPCSCNY